MDHRNMNYEEIKTHYPDSWVILDDVRSDPGPVLRGGRVIYSCSEEDQLYRHLSSLPRGKEYAIRYTGNPPDDISFAL